MNPAQWREIGMRATAALSETRSLHSLLGSVFSRRQAEVVQTVRAERFLRNLHDTLRHAALAEVRLIPREDHRKETIREIEKAFSLE